MPTPPAASHVGTPTVGSEPQHVPRLMRGICTPGAMAMAAVASEKYADKHGVFAVSLHRYGLGGTCMIIDDDY